MLPIMHQGTWRDRWTGLRHSYSDFRWWGWSVRCTGRGGRRRRRRSCVVGLPLNKSPESATSRASKSGACEGEGDDEVEATHFGCWGIYRLGSRFVIKD